MLAIWRLVERFAEVLIILGLTVMTLACLGQVFARYVMQNPLNWTEELARFIFVWVSYLAAWLAWKYRAHIAVDAVSYIDSPSLQMASRRLVEALVLMLCVYTFWTNISLIKLAINQPSPILNVPMGWVYAGYNAMAFLIAGDVLVTWLTERRVSNREPAEL